MLNTDHLKRHERLVALMAETLGLDLDEEVIKAHLSEDDVRDAVLSCTGCAHPEDCDHWLAAQDRAEAAPDYCRNASLFQRLRSLGG